MKTYRLNVVYFLAGLANILADQFCADSLAGFLTKVLLMPLLALILLIPKSRFTPIHILTFTALVFSWAGDILLEFTGAGELFFLAGLLSFMVTQILYSVIFAKTMGTSVTASMLPMVLPVLVYGMLLNGWLYPDLGSMRVPVIIYSLVILTMLALALIRAVSGSAEGRYLVLTGAILFVMSDSLIAISRFAHPIAGSGILIMATYITGQFLIIKGIKSHVKT
jgi:uncharacterized membrane protein YhhN